MKCCDGFGSMPPPPVNVPRKFGPWYGPVCIKAPTVLVSLAAGDGIKPK